MKKFEYLLTAMAAVLLCTGAAHAELGDTAQEPLVIAFQGGAPTLDPIMRSENTAYSWQRAIFDTITMRNHRGELEPRIATSWKNLSPTEWELTLREGVKFQNGDPMTADDVGESIVDTATNPKSQMSFFVSNVSGYKKTADNKIVVTFSKPDPLFPIHLVGVPVMPESYIKKVGREAFDKHPIGTGPYKFVEWLADDHITLEAWDGFWGEKPDFKHVKMKAIPNSATRVAALLSGQAQVIEKVMPQDFPRVEKSGKAYLATAPGFRTMYLALDYWRDQDSAGMAPGTKNPFMDPKVRKAVSLAIDRDLLNKKIFNGAMTTTDQFLPLSFPAHNKALKPLPYDLKQAKALLAQAGYPDGFSVRLESPNDRYMYDSLVAQAIAGMLNKVNIKVEVNAVPKAVFFPSIDKGDFTIYLAGWGSEDAISTYNAMFHCRDKAHGFGTVNREHYCNKKVDDLMVEAANTFEDEPRNKLLKEAFHNVDRGDYAAISLYYQNVIAGAVNEVEWKSRPDEVILAWQMHRQSADQAKKP